MTTIDKLDLSVYNLYAVRTKMIEQINQQLRLDQAGSIPPQISIQDIYPKLTELDILLGIVPLNTPWAFFFPPKNFKTKRRSPFGFSRILPSLGDQEDQDEAEQTIASMVCDTPTEAQEQQALKGFFAQYSKINEWMGHIVGRVGQFLQG